MSESAAPTKSASSRWQDLDMRAAAPFAALAVLMVLGYLVNPVFLTVDNMANVLARCSFVAVIAVGATFVITAGGLDLSVGSMLALISGVMILFFNGGYFQDTYTLLTAGIAVALILGIVCGAANGLGVTVGGIEPFIVTLGTMTIFRSLQTWLAGGGTISMRAPELSSTYAPVYAGKLFGIPFPVIVVAVVALIGAFVLYRTTFGRHVMAVGSNEDVARYSGISVNRVRMLTYIIQGICVAIAVAIYVPRLRSSTATTGITYELQAITAVVVGGTALRGGVGRIWGSICGAVILETIGNIMLLSNLIDEKLIGVVQGAIIILAMLVQRSLSRKS
jgi:ribose transport system permease protein